jgi:hypothetical protein
MCRSGAAADSGDPSIGVRVLGASLTGPAELGFRTGRNGTGSRTDGDRDIEVCLRDALS